VGEKKARGRGELSSGSMLRRRLLLKLTLKSEQGNVVRTRMSAQRVQERASTKKELA